MNVTCCCLHILQDCGIKSFVALILLLTPLQSVTTVMVKFIHRTIQSKDCKNKKKKKTKKKKHKTHKPQ